MLRKLLKYEFRATARLFFPFYLALIVFALFNRLINFQMLIDIDEPVFGFGFLETITFLARLAYFIIIVAILVMTLLIMVHRFYKSLLGEEGYLMFTLPVHPWQHIVSKLVAAVTWTAASALVTVGSIMLLTAKAGMWPVLWEAVSQIKDIVGVTGFIIYPGAVLVTLIAGFLQIYAAIALGQLSSRYRILLSVAWYAALHYVSQLLPLVLFLPYARVHWQRIVEAATDLMYINQLLFWFTLLPAFTLCILYFALANYILSKRLNLE